MKVSVIFGTRPEVIKMATVIKAFEQRKDIIVDVCFTGQHKEMVYPLIEFFELKVDHELDIMQPNQSLAALTSRAITALDQYYESVKPDIVLVQGDTTTAMSAAMAAFYKKIKIAHVEAGLRTNNMYSPFPEEYNRQVISKIAALHFAPTDTAKANLDAEGFPGSSVFVTGNTVIDALLFAKEKIESGAAGHQNGTPWDKEKRTVLITGHRRENFGDGFEDICQAIKTLAGRYTDHNFVYPVHLNPNVQEPVRRLLNDIPNVFLTAPMDYVSFTRLMSQCHIILTDSGGVQEEAPTLGKPVLVMRDTTERMEAVHAGAARLVGTGQKMIIDHVSELLDNESTYEAMSSVRNPFGDGKASERIVKHTLEYLSL